MFIYLIDIGFHLRATDFSRRDVMSFFWKRAVNCGQRLHITVTFYSDLLHYLRQLLSKKSLSRVVSITNVDQAKMPAQIKIVDWIKDCIWPYSSIFKISYGRWSTTGCNPGTVTRLLTEFPQITEMVLFDVELSACARPLPDVSHLKCLMIHVRAIPDETIEWPAKSAKITWHISSGVENFCLASTQGLRERLILWLPSTLKTLAADLPDIELDPSCERLDQLEQLDLAKSSVKLARDLIDHGMTNVERFTTLCDREVTHLLCRNDYNLEWLRLMYEIDGTEKQLLEELCPNLKGICYVDFGKPLFPVEL